MPEAPLHTYLKKRISHEGPYEDLLDFPLYFEIETVNACNARCPFCTIDDWHRHSPTMKMDLFRKIADEIIENKERTRRVALYRDGEPLLDKKMPDRIAYLKEGGVDKVGISTNVSLLNEENSRRLLESGIDEIILSIDSMRKDVFEAMRVRLKFEEVKENALRFIEMRNRMNTNTQVWVRMIATDKNRDEWPEYEAFWKPRLRDSDRLYWHSEHNWGDQLDAAANRAMSYEPTLPCVALWSLMVIFSDGRVPLCNVDYNLRHPTGDLNTESIREVWQSQVMAERRHHHLTGEKGPSDMCANCNVWDEQAKETASLISSQYGDLVEIQPS